MTFLFIDKEQKEQKVKKELKPTVSFYDSIMYEITDLNVKQIVKSKQADIYNNKEELTDATIVVKSDKNSYDTNIASSNSMIKIGDDVYLKKNVNLQLSDGTNVKTEQLDYNLKSKIATNNTDFMMIRETDTFKGKGLYLDSIKEHIKSENTKFRMKVENNE